MKSKFSKGVIGVVAVVVIAAIAGFWWFTSRDAPEEASLDKAIAGAGTDNSTPVGKASAEVDGTWNVDTNRGAFDFESATGTFVGFRIKEELARLGSATAVGRTGDVKGSIKIADSELTEAKFDVNTTSIKTNDIRRDYKVQSALETQKFPTASFELTEPVKLGADATSGKKIKATATGELTIHGKTRKIQMPIEAKYVDGTIAVVGSTQIKFSDYGVEVPHSPVVLSVEDHGVLELQLLFAR